NIFIYIRGRNNELLPTQTTKNIKQNKSKLKLQKIEGKLIMKRVWLGAFLVALLVVIASAHKDQAETPSSAVADTPSSDKKEQTEAPSSDKKEKKEAKKEKDDDKKEKDDDKKEKKAKKEKKDKSDDGSKQGSDKFGSATLDDVVPPGNFASGPSSGGAPSPSN
ncbi:hypothetical protein LINPERPRIM_LOCUS43549, partial [Linum perenne]